MKVSKELHRLADWTYVMQKNADVEAYLWELIRWSEADRDEHDEAV